MSDFRTDRYFEPFITGLEDCVNYFVSTDIPTVLLNDFVFHSSHQQRCIKPSGPSKVISMEGLLWLSIFTRVILMFR